MSPYLSVVIVIGLFGGGALLGYNYATYKAKDAAAEKQVAQDNVVINAQDGVIKTQQKQATITEKTNETYHTGIAVIDSMYGVQPIQPNPSNNLSSYGKPSVGTGSNITKSKRYGLTLKTCDIEEAKLVGLWQWNQEQLAALR